MSAVRRTDVLPAALVVIAAMIGCKGGSGADGARDAPPAPQQAPTVATPQATGAPPATSRLSLRCPPKTWPEARAEAKARASDSAVGDWLKQRCDELEVSYKFRAARGAGGEGLEMVVRFPHKGRPSAAVMKEALDALLPNAGAPARSVGSCEPTASAKAAFAPLGKSEVEGFVTRVRQQGGFRAALFEIDGTTLSISPTLIEEKNPGLVSFMIHEGDGAAAELGDYPPIPWESSAPCK